MTFNPRVLLRHTFIVTGETWGQVYVIIGQDWMYQHSYKATIGFRIKAAQLTKPLGFLESG